MENTTTLKVLTDLAVGKDTTVGGNINARGSVVIDHNLEVKGWLKAYNLIGACRGYFSTIDKLESAYPHPHVGEWALVGTEFPADIYRVDESGTWSNTGLKSTGITVVNADLTELEQAVTDEATARKAADEALQANIDQEVSERKAADTLEASERNKAISAAKTAMQEKIDAEATARAAADNTLQANIDTESTTRSEAVKTLQETDATNKAYLIQFIRGRSEDNNGFYEPFIYGGSFKAAGGGFGAMLEQIGDDPVSSDDVVKYTGHVRYDIQGIMFDVQNYPISYASKSWLQVISGGLVLNADGTLSQKMSQYGTFYRTSGNGVWSTWNDIQALDPKSVHHLTLTYDTTTHRLYALPYDADGNLLASYTDADGHTNYIDLEFADYQLPQATANTLGGVRAEPGIATDTDLCVKIIPETGRLFVPRTSGLVIV